MSVTSLTKASFLAAVYLQLPRVAISLAIGSTAAGQYHSVAQLNWEGRGNESNNFARVLPDWSNCSTSLTAHLDSHLALAPTGDVQPSSRLGFSPTVGATVKLVNAGLGSSGTSAFFLVLCDNGVPSVHWFKSCHISDAALAIHSRIVDRHKDMRDCAHGLLGREDPRCSVGQHLAEIKADLQALVVSGVVALVDTPYTDLLPELMSLLPDVKIVQTLRDSVAWAGRRLRGHGIDVLCKPPASEQLSSYYNILECGESFPWVADAIASQENVFRSDAVAVSGGANPVEIGGSLQPYEVAAVAQLVREKYITSDADNFTAAIIQPAMESAVRLAAARYAAHNAFVMRTVPSERLRQVCVWDDSDLAHVLEQTLLTGNLVPGHTSIVIRIEVTPKSPGFDAVYNLISEPVNVSEWSETYRTRPS
eukprot:TRINITY_DN70973_c0_g1_i1.p1 TRINITY_DN70973_c0_g1~~TRINITY_DN70973_c0_g1_i1.p1  ORF type:complete len:422 (-),score=44.68 TRINITY_DN70973_c0_g1_i1:110-1375(-)